MEVFFITGSSSGIGEALAKEALERGHKVFGISRSQKLAHNNYEHLFVDLANEQAVTAFEFPKIKDNYERITLVNNAGAIGDIKRIGSANAGVMAHLFRLNVTAPALLMNTFIAQFGSYQNPTVLNVGSGAGQYEIDAWAPYCASKAAMDHFSRTVQQEQKITGGKVRILCYGPGVVDTQMQEEIRKSNSDDFSRADDFKAMKANNELVAPAQVAKEYFQVLDDPKRFTEVVGSLRDLR